MAKRIFVFELAWRSDFLITEASSVVYFNLYSLSSSKSHDQNIGGVQYKGFFLVLSCFVLQHFFFFIFYLLSPEQL